MDTIVCKDQNKIMIYNRFATRNSINDILHVKTKWYDAYSEHVFTQLNYQLCIFSCCFWFWLTNRIIK